MAGQQRIYKQRITSTETLGKVFRAMEMIAASRIGTARKRATEVGPYERAVTHAVAAVAAHTDLRHPLTSHVLHTPRVAVLVVASDRGMAGAFSATILRHTEHVLNELRDEGKEPVLYTCGRRARQYFSFRKIPIEHAWEGESDAPTPELAYEIASKLELSFLNGSVTTGLSEVYLVYMRFKNMMSQVAAVRKMLPLTVVDAPESDDLFDENQTGNSEESIHDIVPEYEFIPDAQSVLDALLPLYFETRIYNVLLQSAASELASRQRAMHTATDNADELITKYTRLANSARQAEITQEISEIVGGADALVKGSAQ